MCMPPRDRAITLRFSYMDVRSTAYCSRHQARPFQPVSRCFLSVPVACYARVQRLSIRGSAPLPFNAQRLHKCGTRAYSLLLLAPGGYSIVPGK